MNDLLKVGARSIAGIAKPFQVEEDGMISVPDTSAMLQRVTTPKKLQIPTYDGSHEPVHPAVVRTQTPWNGYRYWMAFTPYPHGDDTKENPSIVASVDGVTWVVPNGLTNPIAPKPSPSGSYNRDTQLIFAPEENGGKGRMYCYWMRMYVSPIGQRSYSDDGIHWSTPEDTNHDLWGIVRKSATEWEAFVKSGTNYFIKWISEDGLTWRRGVPYIPTNLRGNMWHHSVFLDSTGYHFLASCFQEGGTIGWQCLYYGYSKDGTDVVFDTTPLLIPKDNSFYGTKLYQSVMIPWEDDRFRIYFSCCGGSDYSTWSIGCFDAKMSAPQAKYYAHRLPRPESAERFILWDEEIRDAERHDINVPEFSEFEKKVLLIHNSLADAEGNAVPVTIYVSNNLRYNFGNTTAGDAIEVGGLQEGQKVEVDATTYFPHLYGKEHLYALGYMLPHLSGLSYQAKSAPASGTFTIQMKAWA